MIKLSTFIAIFLKDYQFDFCSSNCRATFWPPCIFQAKNAKLDFSAKRSREMPNFSNLK